MEERLQVIKNKITKIGVDNTLVTYSKIKIQI